MLELVQEYRGALHGEQLVATGTTGGMIAERTGLPVRCVASSPLGGDLQIGAHIARGDVKLVIFMRDPLSAHPHEPDIQALIKVCDIHHVPLPTNRTTARLCLEALTRDAEELGALVGRR
jgi:methylglyoxal synthase